MREKTCYQSLLPVLFVVLLLWDSVAWAKKREAYSGPCTRNVSSAIANSMGAEPLIPDFVTNWWNKNAKDYPGVCLSSKPTPAVRNYLMIFSTSASYYSGLMPTTHMYTSTSSTAFSTNGSVTDQYGDRWNYTATGDAQTTTTTTVHENVPYTDRSAGLFVKTYDSTGRIIRSDGHMYRSRTGGDTYNTAGYNIGSALSNINARGKMLRSALLAIETDQNAPLPATQARPAAYESGGSEVVPERVFIWFDELAPAPGAPLFEVVVTARAYDGALAILRQARQGNTSVRAGLSVLDTDYHPSTTSLASWQQSNPNSAPSLFYWQGEEVSGTTLVMHFQMTKRAYEQMLALLAGSDLRLRPSQTGH